MDVVVVDADFAFLKHVYTSERFIEWSESKTDRVKEEA